MCVCRGTADVALAQSVPVRPARNEAELARLEAAYAVLDLYVWLSYRLEDSFPGRTLALQQRAGVAALVEEALPRILADPDAVSRRCGFMLHPTLIDTAILPNSTHLWDHPTGIRTCGHGNQSHNEAL